MAALDRLGLALNELHAAAHAVLALARTQAQELAARSADDDEWKRMPTGKDRCEISRWSITTIKRRIASGEVRRKRVAGTSYYSGSDVRRLISEG